MWENHLYARLEIPEADANAIRSALEAVLLGGPPLTDHQKELLTKLRARLEEQEEVSHVGPPEW